mgnify:CR=1 FL=1|tara:strand:- start:1485 stop:2363 length:879 start_codon:yes stop_codon:yes gene_type:complete
MNQQNPDKPQILIEGLEPPEIEPRGYLHKLKLDFDPESQLREIHKLLKRNEEADQTLDLETKESEQQLKTLQEDETAEYQRLDMAEATVIDHYHEATYQGIAHSMAAVGMLAPFMETIFNQCFQNLGEKYPREQFEYPKHDRWQKIGKDFWDCRIKFIFPVQNQSTGGQQQAGKIQQKNAVLKGVEELAEATGLIAYLPADYLKVFSALKSYRDSMFHNGMEWPLKERTEFINRLEKNKDSAAWFAKATTGEEESPWMIFMTEKFIKRCLQLAEEVLDAFGALVKSLEEQTS